MKRRDFLKYGAAGVSALAVGSCMPWLLQDPAYAQVPLVQTLNFRITDAMKDMVTNNQNTTSAQCYFWIYKEANLPPECPGPNIFATQGDTITVTLTNDLDEPHSMFIPGMFYSGPIAPNQTVTKTFVAKKSGTHLYFDILNTPVNRVMGLHGAFIVMPKAPFRPALKYTPYDVPTIPVQKLFQHLGTTPWWPGLSWQDGDPNSDTPAFRQYVWLLHQASPVLFAEVGNYPPGQNYPANQFVNAFLRDPFSPTRNNRIPQYFTISGQSGHFSHNNPFLCPNNRVGEPALIRILNAGLWTHSLHIHANHVYVICRNGVVEKNPLWVDVYQANPMDVMDWLVPYMRPPDVPNQRGIGRADPPLTTLTNGTTWPPNEEIGYFFPKVGTTAGAIDISVQLSPLCYPMHDHSEPSQTAQGGNYNLGLISGLNFTGDRTIFAPAVTTFPNAPLIHGPNSTGTPAGPEHV